MLAFDVFVKSFKLKRKINFNVQTVIQANTVHAK